MEGGRLQLTQEIILFIITTGITAVLGVIGYFLKRTMDRNDKNEAAVQELRDNLLTLSDKYATKAEIREIKASMEKLSENSVLVLYNNLKYDDGDGLRHKAAFVRKITVER